MRAGINDSVLRPEDEERVPYYLWGSAQGEGGSGGLVVTGVYWPLFRALTQEEDQEVVAAVRADEDRHRVGGTEHAEARALDV